MNDPTHPDRHELDAAASDAVDGASTTEAAPDSVVARASDFAAIGERMRDVAPRNDLSRRAQINAALDTMDGSQHAATGHGGHRGLSFIGKAAAAMLVAGTAVGLGSLAVRSGDDEATTMADSASVTEDDASVAGAGSGGASRSAGDVAAFGDFSSAEEFTAAYRVAAEATALAPDGDAPSAAAPVDASEAGVASTAANETTGDPEASPAQDESFCSPAGVVAEGTVAGRPAVVVSRSSGNELAVVFLDDCSVVPTTSSP